MISLSALKLLHSDVSVQKNPMSPLRCENISCRRAASNETRSRFIEDFSAVFESGDITGFCGSDTEEMDLLLNILGMIERPDSGRLEVLDREVLTMPAAESMQHRDTSFGYLFTHPHLLPSFTVAENVAMPFFRICGRDDEAEARECTLKALEFTGVADLHGVPVGELHEPANWRVALARAIVHSPAVLIAVSPPSPLLLPLVRRLADEFGTAVLWNGEKTDLEPFANQLVEMTPR
jgi:ABC-type lipoprotein export system ATPase subunit